MSSPVVSGVDASPYPHPHSRILTPSSESSHHRSEEACAPNVDSNGKQKHRSASAAMNHLLRPPIFLKAHPHSIHAQPRALQPLMLLPRKYLPLSSFDMAAPQGDLPRSRFYESNIKILELESRLGSACPVMLARNESKGIVYAIERQEDGLFVACKLGSWVDLVALADRSTVCCDERVYAASNVQPTELNAASSLITPQTRKAEKVKRNAIEAIQSLVKKRARSQSVVNSNEASGVNSPVETPKSQDGDVPIEKDSAMDAAVSSTGPSPNTPQPGPSAPIVQDASPRQSSESLFDAIRTMYFEALYKSKGSLAYFAKGPLSRARSAFHLDLESNLDLADLIDFLKGLVLTTVQIDKKYRETVLELILQMKAVADSSDETPKRKRKSKKMKLGKDGLYPFEADSVRTWWQVNKPELREDAVTISKPQLNSHVSLLRSRETQLQMILILEILSLEKLKTSDTAPDNNLPVLPGSNDAIDSAMAPPPPPAKKRNKHNLPVLVDVHADRLTIWQSTATDELLLLEDSQASVAHATNMLADPKTSSEPLKDFCVDIILPFYSSRLPQLCDSLNKKLGGPTTIAPRKPKPAKQSSDKKDKDQRPGAAARRVAQRREPRTLERALSFDQEHRRSMSRGPSSALALMRPAASMAVPPGIKREDSDSSLLSKLGASKLDSDSSSSRRNSLVRSSSMADLQDLKVVKKAKVEAELKDAISALRKPNRECVGKAMAEADQRRASTLFSTKARKPSRLSTKSNVQVEATPANNRFRDVFESKVDVTPDVPLPSTEGIIPQSSAGRSVPSSLAPQRQQAHFGTARSPASDAIGCTPLKPSASSRLLVDEPLALPSSPLFGRKGRSQAPAFALTVSEVSGTPVRQGLTSHRDAGNVLPATPIKKSTIAPGAMSLPMSPIGKENKVSIYDRLGWDDDVYD